jgi:hypothetical protein
LPLFVLNPIKASRCLWSAVRTGRSRQEVAIGVVILAAVAGAAGCSSSRSRTTTNESRPVHTAAVVTEAPVSRTVIARVASVAFGRVSAVVLHECRATADAVDYAVPCPTLLPIGSAATVSPEPRSCRFAIVAPADSPTCHAPQARRWIFGTSGVNGVGIKNIGFAHLVLTAAPRVLRNPARAIDGPVVYPERVLPRGTVQIHATTMHWYLVPMDNPSAFRGHLVLLWTAAGRTYVYGFHVIDTIAKARAIDLELVRHLKTVYPQKDSG